MKCHKPMYSILHKNSPKKELHFQNEQLFVGLIFLEVQTFTVSLLINIYSKKEKCLQTIQKGKTCTCALRYMRLRSALKQISFCRSGKLHTWTPKSQKKCFSLDTESHICSIKPVECTALKSDERRHASTMTQKTLG